MCVNVKDSFDMVMFNSTLLLLLSTNNDRHILHTWLDKNYRSPGMYYNLCSLSNVNVNNLHSKIMTLKNSE